MAKDKFKVIDDLSELDNNALIYLYERTRYIQRLNQQISMFANVKNFEYFSAFTNLQTIVDAYTKLCCILYRSLFQSASFNELIDIKYRISIQCYFSNVTKWEKKHNHIINYVNSVLAHQDQFVKNGEVKYRAIATLKNGKNTEFHPGTISPLLLPDPEFYERLDEIASKINSEYFKRNDENIIIHEVGLFDFI